MTTQMRVLVVDDDRDAAELAADRIRDGIDGATVDVELDTDSARARLDDADYDAVVADYRIGDSDGLAFLETVHDLDETVPFVIYTGTGSERVASRAIGAGVTDYIPKTEPGAGTRLVDSLRTAVSRARMTEDVDLSSRENWLVDQNFLGVAVVQDGRFRFVNERVADLLGYGQAELLDEMGPEDIVDPADQALVAEAFEQLREGAAETRQYGFTARRRDGTPVELEVFTGVVEYRDDPAFLGLFSRLSPDRRRERGLSALDDAARDLMAATTRDRVASVAVTHTRSVLEREFGAIYRPGDDGFEPVATTSGFDALFGGEPPAYPDDGLLATATDGTTVHRFDDADHLGDPFRSGVVAGLGRHGVYVVGAPEPNAFDEASVDLVELLAASVETALDRTLREERLAGLNEAGEGLVRATHPDVVAEIAVRTASDVLGFDYATLYRAATDEQGAFLQPVATNETRRRRPEPLPELRPDQSLTWDAFETREIRVVGDLDRDAETLTQPTPFRSLVVFPLADHGVLAVGAPTPDAFDEDDVGLGQVLAATVAAALDRTDHERRLEALVESTERLEAAETPGAVANVAIETARDVLGHEFCAIHVPEGDTLVPSAGSEGIRSLLGEQPALGQDSLAWAAFEADEVLRFGDVRDADPVNPETPVRSELFLPLGEQGVFIVSSTTEDAFDRTDVRLAELFAAAVRAAMERAKREATVARQNERLEEFASVVSHDLRNPLGVAMGRLEMAMASTDDPNLPIVDRALDRMETLVGDLLTLARQGQTLAGTEPVDLEPLVRDVWRSQDAPDATLVVADDLPTVDGDPGRLRQLFENLFGNAIRHAGEAVTVTVGRAGRGFYVADDGPGIPPDDREQVLEGGYTTSREGTGFGLAIVRSIAGAHGWSVVVGESESGGARFTFEW
jgi:PAS domain S-box-containing protein